MKFTENELNKLGFIKEEINTIMECQERLPILSKGNDNDHWINSRDLWEQLGVGSDYSHWIKHQIKTLDLVENIDYQLYCYGDERPVQWGGANRVDYIITSSVGKDITLIVGVKGGRTSEELIKNSKLARKYFKLIDKVMERNKIVDNCNNRDFEEISYDKMCKELNNFFIRIIGKSAEEIDYLHEMEMINTIITGIDTSNAHINYGVSLAQTIHDFLKKDNNNELAFLEHENAIFLSMGMGLEARKKMLITMYDIYMKGKAVLSA